MIEDIVRLRDGLNSAFEFMAAKLPQLSDELSLTASRLRVCDASGIDDFAALTRTKDTLELEIERATAWMLTARSALHSMLSDLRPGVNCLMQALAEVSRGARQLRLVALNASFVAQRGGDGMRGFAAATTELIRIGAEELSESEHVIEIVGGVSEKFEELESLGSELTSLVQAIAGLETNKALQNVIITLSNIESRLFDVAERCGSIRQGIGRAMEAIQRQDILRQGLDHVELVAGAIAKCEAAVRVYSEAFGDREAALQSAKMLELGAALCADLIEHMEAEILGFLSDIESHLNGLVEISETVDQVAADVVSGDLQRQVGALHERVEGLGRYLTEGTNARARESQILSALCLAVKELPNRLQVFVERRDQVRALGVLVRRQDAQTGGLGGAKAIGESLDALQDGRGTSWIELLSDTLLIRAKLREFSNPGRQTASNTTGGLASYVTELETVTQSMTERTEYATANTKRAVGQIGMVAHQMLTEVEMVRRKVQSSAALSNNYRELSKMGASFLERLDAQHPTSVQLPVALQELIDRFTILAHKQLAGVTRGQLEDPVDESGSVTLF